MERIAVVSVSRAVRLRAYRLHHYDQSVREYACLLELQIGDRELAGCDFVNRALELLAQMMRLQREKPQNALRSLYIVNKHFTSILRICVESWEYEEAVACYEARLHCTMALLAERGLSLEHLSQFA